MTSHYDMDHLAVVKQDSVEPMEELQQSNRCNENTAYKPRTVKREHTAVKQVKAAKHSKKKRRHVVVSASSDSNSDSEPRSRQPFSSSIAATGVAKHGNYSASLARAATSVVAPPHAAPPRNHLDPRATSHAASSLAAPPRNHLEPQTSCARSLDSRASHHEQDLASHSQQRSGVNSHHSVSKQPGQVASLQANRVEEYFNKPRVLVNMKSMGQEMQNHDLGALFDGYKTVETAPDVAWVMDFMSLMNQTTSAFNDYDKEYDKSLSALKESGKVWLPYYCDKSTTTSMQVRVNAKLPLAVYLYGSQGVGKLAMVDYFIRHAGLANNCLKITPSIKNPLENFLTDRHHIIVIEALHNLHDCEIHSLLKYELMPVMCHGSYENRAFRVPIIIVSEFPPPAEHSMNMIIVCANCPLPLVRTLASVPKEHNAKFLKAHVTNSLFINDTPLVEGPPEILALVRDSLGMYTICSFDTKAEAQKCINEQRNAARTEKQNHEAVVVKSRKPRQMWSSAEVGIIRSQFASFFNEMRVPSRSEVAKFASMQPLLKHRSVTSIHSKIKALIKQHN